MNIDWSLAPKGATHFIECADPKFLKAFFAIESDDRYVEVGAQTFFRKCDEGRLGWTVTARPTIDSWNGEGLPPVGTVCEYAARPAGKGEPLWATVKVHYLSTQTIVIECIAFPDAARKDNIGVELPVDVGVSTINRFRPIRTPEQIAADEREAGIQALKQIFDSCSDELMPTSNKYLDTLFGAIYDAGYRKQVQP